MPNEIVEGYTASQQATGASSQPLAPPSALPSPPANVSPTSIPPGPAADAWIASMRRDLRREMIRELALKRIRAEGRRDRREPTRFGRMVEAFFVGVAVTLVSSWVCARAMSDARREERKP